MLLGRYDYDRKILDGNKRFSVQTISVLLLQTNLSILDTGTVVLSIAFCIFVLSNSYFYISGHPELAPGPPAF